MMPSKPKRNSVKPLYSRAENPSDEAPAASPHPDLQDESDTESVDSNTPPSDDTGDGDNEPSDEEIVDSLVEGLTPEQKSLLLQKLQEDSSKTQNSNNSSSNSEEDYNS